MADGEKQRRNITRSKRQIREAFARILNEKDIQKITVTDVVTEANISRGTFYAYYVDVHDLYQTLENEALAYFVNMFESVGVAEFLDNPQPTVDSFMAHINTNRDYFRHLFLAKNIGDFTMRLSQTFTERVINGISQYSVVLSNDRIYVPKSAEIKIFMVYLSSAIKSVMLRWVDGAYTELSDSEVSAIISTLIKNDTKAFLEYNSNKKAL